MIAVPQTYGLGSEEKYLNEESRAKKYRGASKSDDPYVHQIYFNGHFT